MKNVEKDMRFPLVSIVTPVFNVEKNISLFEKSINSVLSQDYPKIEYIVVDGASTDGTKKFLFRNKNKFDLMISEKDDGIYDAMNKGLDHAKGEIIYFLGADDCLADESVVFDVVKIFLSKKADFVYGKVILFDEFPGSKKLVGREIKEKDLYMGVGICHQALFVKSNLLRENNKFNTNYSLVSDYDFEAKIFKQKRKGVFINRLIAFFNGTGASSEKSGFMEKAKAIRLNFGLFAFYKFLFVFPLKHKIYLFLRKIRFFEKNGENL